MLYPKNVIKNKMSLGFDRLRNKPCKNGLCNGFLGFCLLCVISLDILREIDIETVALPL